MSNITQKQKAYEYIREKLVTGELAPGSRLSEVTLAKEIGISRTPVREAINQLASDDLVTLVPHSGAFVKVPDQREILELYELRELLECYVVRKAAEEISEENLMQLTKLYEEMASIIAALETEEVKAPVPEIRRRWVMTDYAFHLVLFRCGGNRKVLRIASELRMLTQAFIFRKDEPDLSLLLIIKNANKEHRELLNSVRRRDPVAASRIMSRHITRAKNNTLASFDEVEPAGDSKTPDWLASIRDVINA